MSRRCATAVIALSLCIAAVSISSRTNAQDQQGAEPITLHTQPIPLSRTEPDRIRFGDLVWRGGIALDSPSPRFGGFSGLVLSPDGERLVAVSDQGWWFTVQLDYRDGRLTGASDAAMAPLLSADGRRHTAKRMRDAEALAAFDASGPGGSLLIGFERSERIEKFDFGAEGFRAKPVTIDMPDAIASGRNNGELEALARLHDGPFTGWFLAISERNFDYDGNLRGWRWRDEVTVEFSLPRYKDYLVTDIVPLPGGEVFITLERSFVSNDNRGMVLRRFHISDLEPGQVHRGTMLLELRVPEFTFDNMEGIALHRTDNGETRLTIISDDNYNRGIQRTLLLQFALE